MIALYMLVLLVLIFLNAFFVLAEFAIVKVRPTQMDALIAHGDKRARRVKRIQSRLDEYLSVCQVGITFASIGLGFVGEPAVADLVRPLIQFATGAKAEEPFVHGIAIAVGYLAVSFLHIILGELIPKSFAIRLTVKAALWIAFPLQVFRTLFFLPNALLNGIVTSILRLFRLPLDTSSTHHSEDEVRVILGQSQSTGMLSFRRLLFIENVLDMGDLAVRDAMRPRSQVQYLRADATREANAAVISKYRFSRYPLVDRDPDNPVGFVHVKDLYIAGLSGQEDGDLWQNIRPALRIQMSEPLESVLSIMQRKGVHFALVFDNARKWAGILTLEDAVEEVIGSIEEEFPIEAPVTLSAFLNPSRVVFDVAGATIAEVVRNALTALPAGELPVKVEEVMPNILERERLGPSYVGNFLAIPHARISGLREPVVVFARMKTPIPVPNLDTPDEVRYLFILLTPAGVPRIHQVLLANIAGIFESDYIGSHLATAASPSELYQEISVAEQTTLAG